MKKWIQLLLTAVLTLSCLSGCGVQNGNQTPPAESGQAPSTGEGETHVVEDALGRSVELPVADVTAVVSNAYNMELVNAIGAIDQVVGVDWYIWQDAESWKGRFTEDMEVGKDPEMNY